MSVLTVLNQKGGVGKTSTCYHLAGSVAQSGQRVLLVDADPQSSLTQGFFGPTETRRIAPECSIAGILAGNEPYPAQVIRPTGFDRIEIVPGSRQAADFNLPRPQDQPWPIQVSLRDFLEPIRSTYDLILIDCPPNLHLCSWATLVASDSIIVPIQPEDFGAQGIADVLESIARVKAGANPKLNLLGFVISMIATRQLVHQKYETVLRDTYGDQVFTSMIPRLVDFAEAILSRKPMALYKPKGVASKAIAAVAAEIEARSKAEQKRGAA